MYNCHFDWTRVWFNFAEEIIIFLITDTANNEHMCKMNKFLKGTERHRL